MKKFYDNYQDPQGDAIEGAAVTITNSDGSLATLYASNSITGTLLTNPVTTDALGYYWFYIPDGRYNIKFTKVGFVDLLLTDVEIADEILESAVVDAKIATAIAKLSLTSVPGPAGQGVPKGGNAGQVPKKRSNTDYDVIWADESVATGFRPEVDLIPDAQGVAQMTNGASNNFLLILTKDVTIPNPTGFQAGDRIRLIFEQDNLGGHGITFGSGFQYSGNTTPAFSKSAGAIYRLDLDLIKGGIWVITPFIIQYDGNASNLPTQPNPGDGTGTARKLITVYPWDGSAPVVVAAMLDATTLAEARAAANAAALGSKRAAYLAAVRAAFGSTQTLTLKRDGSTIVALGYTGQLTNVTLGQDLGLGLSTMQDASAMAPGDINTGAWTAILTSGTRVCTMDVGPAGSGKMLVLSNSTAAGKGIIPTMNLLAQRVTDGLL